MASRIEQIIRSKRTPRTHHPAPDKPRRHHTRNTPVFSSLIIHLTLLALGASVAVADSIHGEDDVQNMLRKASDVRVKIVTQQLELYEISGRINKIAKDTKDPVLKAERIKLAQQLGKQAAQLHDTAKAYGAINSRMLHAQSEVDMMTYLSKLDETSNRLMNTATQESMSKLRERFVDAGLTSLDISPLDTSRRELSSSTKTYRTASNSVIKRAERKRDSASWNGNLGVSPWTRSSRQNALKTQAKELGLGKTPLAERFDLIRGSYLYERYHDKDHLFVWNSKNGSWTRIKKTPGLIKVYDESQLAGRPLDAEKFLKQLDGLDEINKHGQVADRMMKYMLRIQQDREFLRSLPKHMRDALIASIDDPELFNARMKYNRGAFKELGKLFSALTGPKNYKDVRLGYLRDAGMLDGKPIPPPNPISDKPKPNMPAKDPDNGGNGDNKVAGGKATNDSPPTPPRNPATMSDDDRKAAEAANAALTKHRTEIAKIRKQMNKIIQDAQSRFTAIEKDIKYYKDLIKKQQAEGKSFQNHIRKILPATAKKDPEAAAELRKKLAMCSQLLGNGEYVWSSYAGYYGIKVVGSPDPDKKVSDKFSINGYRKKIERLRGFKKKAIKMAENGTLAGLERDYTSKTKTYYHPTNINGFRNQINAIRKKMQAHEETLRKLGLYEKQEDRWEIAPLVDPGG